MEIKLSLLTPYENFLYGLKVPETKRQYPSRLNTFMKFIGLEGNETIQEKCIKKLKRLSKIIEIPKEDLNKSIEAIKTRNVIVHEGSLNDKDHYAVLSGLFRTIAIIHFKIFSVKIKYPPHKQRFLSRTRII